MSTIAISIPFTYHTYMSSIPFSHSSIDHHSCNCCFISCVRRVSPYFVHTTHIAWLVSSLSYYILHLLTSSFWFFSNCCTYFISNVRYTPFYLFEYKYENRVTYTHTFRFSCVNTLLFRFVLMLFGFRGW